MCKGPESETNMGFPNNRKKTRVSSSRESEEEGNIGEVDRSRSCKSL